MSLFSQTRRTVRETALVITADTDDDLTVFRKSADKWKRADCRVTGQQNVYKDKLRGFQLHFTQLLSTGIIYQKM